MRLIERYLLKEIFPPTLLSLFIFSFLLLMNTILHLADLLIRRGVDLRHILQMMLYLTPSIVVFTIPIGVLLGIMVGLNRLVSDGEVTAILAGGISPYRFLRPIMIFALLFFLIDLWLMNYALPWGNQSFRELDFKILSGRIISGEVKPRVFNEDFPGKVLYISEVDEKTGLWKRVFIFDQGHPGESQVILAKEGIPIFEKRKRRLILELSEAKLYQTSNIDPEKRTSFANFKHMYLVLLSMPSLAELNLGKDERSMRADELREEIWRTRGESRLTGILINKSSEKKSLQIRLKFVQNSSEKEYTFPLSLLPKERKYISLPFIAPAFPQDSSSVIICLIFSGKLVFSREFTLNKLPPTLLRHLRINGDLIVASLGFQELNPKGNHFHFEVEYHKRYAIPFACLVFGILGFSFALKFRRSGKAGSYVIGLIVFVVYWAFFINGEAFGDKGIIPPFLGMWAANIFFGAIALLLLAKIKFSEGTRSSLLRFLSNQSLVFVSNIRKIFRNRRRAKRRRMINSEASFSFSKKIPFPSILDRYITKNFITIFFLVLFGVYSIFALVDFIEMNQEIEKNNLSHILLVDFFKFKLPQILIFIIPISILMATMVTLGIMAKNKETTAAKAGGISIYRLFIPFLVFALIGSGIVFLIQDRILPYSNQRLSEIIQIIKGAPPQTYRQAKGSRYLFGKGNRIFHHEGYDEEHGVIRRFTAYEFDQETLSLKEMIFALSLRWDKASGRWLSYNDGWLSRFSANKVTVKRFHKLRNHFPPEEPSYFSRIIREPEEMSFNELRLYIKELKGSGVDTTREEVELYWKTALPFLTLIITLIGLAFSLRGEKGGAITGIFFSITIVVIYWVFWSVFKNLGYLGILPPFLAAWSPNLIFGAGALYLILTLRT